MNIRGINIDNSSNPSPVTLNVGHSSCWYHRTLNTATVDANTSTRFWTEHKGSGSCAFQDGWIYFDIEGMEFKISSDGGIVYRKDGSGCLSDTITINTSNGTYSCD